MPREILQSCRERFRWDHRSSSTSPTYRYYFKCYPNVSDQKCTERLPTGVPENAPDACSAPVSYWPRRSRIRSFIWSSYSCRAFRTSATRSSNVSRCVPFGRSKVYSRLFGWDRQFSESAFANAFRFVARRIQIRFSSSLRNDTRGRSTPGKGTGSRPDGAGDTAFGGVYRIQYR